MSRKGELMTIVRDLLRALIVGGVLCFGMRGCYRDEASTREYNLSMAKLGYCQTYVYGVGTAWQPCKDGR